MVDQTEQTPVLAMLSVMNQFSSAISREQRKRKRIAISKPPMVKRDPEITSGDANSDILSVSLGDSK